ncbi:hypothetical protein PHET_04844 [Paragonimus heterotremus]|uniref:DUF5745 domain-containing protein n=1 Tax=Paragonimus heterotremus TaxID=100268 RepID=A0A8J4SM94_9TREM|nr:hypothetical protein PHET_04844 [Paragonimus heterotremus]
MTVKHDRLMLSDEGLLSVANYALILIRSTPYLKRAKDVNAHFIIRLSVELFGDDFLPYPDALCALHFHENLAAVLCKLSSEIGVELDHIEPREVLKGNRRSVANLLELITAFIAHCVDENLLDFADVDYASTNSPQFAEGCAGLGDVNLTSHLSTSPELPRCVGRSCVPSSPLQHSLQNNTSVKMTHDSGLPQTISNDDTTAPSGVMNRDLVDNWPRFVIRQDAVNTPRQECRPSTNALPQLPLHRHLSIASMQAGTSPPTTPKTVDDFVEIVRHDSPPSAAPSLKSSPVSSKPLRDEPQLDKLDTPALVTGFTDPKQCTTTTGNHVRESKDDGHTNTTLLAEGTCIAIAPQITPLHDHRHRKVSSSSSGRGHSPTHTLTAPGATSATSVPQSLSESPRDPDQRSLNEHVLNCTPKSDTPVRPRRKLTHSRRRHIGRRGVSRGTHSSTATDSILAWTVDEGASNKKEAVTDLSSSLYSGLDHSSVTLPFPSASVLMARTESFTKALQQRLNYLRTIFCRAHDEAEAVNRLVQALGLQNNDTLELMRRCLECRKSTSTNPTVYSNKLERTLERFIAHVDLLLERLPAVLPLAVHQQPTNVFRQSSSKQRTRGGVPVFRTTHRPVRKPESDFIHDSEFEGLMELKHRLMLDALKMYRSELNTQQLSSKLPSEFRCPRCHFVV